MLRILLNNKKVVHKKGHKATTCFSMLVAAPPKNSQKGKNQDCKIKFNVLHSQLVKGTVVQYRPVHFKDNILYKISKNNKISIKQ